MKRSQPPLILFAVLVLIVGTIAGLTALVVHSADHRAQQKAAGAVKSASTSFNRTAHSTTDPSSPWVVVNKQHPLQPKDYAPDDLILVGNGQLMRAEAADALQKMLAAAKRAGHTITPASGYRSYQTQVTAYNSEVDSYGQTYADDESARPGYSEHQTGWAIDLAADGCNITDCFATTPSGKWVNANAYRYGFILRYTAAKTAVTGYRAEAWHYRYIGVPLATELHTEHVKTLEEFFRVSGGPNYAD